MDNQEERLPDAQKNSSSPTCEENTVTQELAISDETEQETVFDEDALMKEVAARQETVLAQSNTAEGTEDNAPIIQREEEKAPAAPIEDEQEDEKDHERFAVSAHYFVEVFTLTLCVILFLTTFLTRHTVVDGGSMDNTLQDGQHLLISDLFYTPDRGDVVVLQSPEETHLKSPIVKRIIAMGGDTVRIEAGVVYVNGEALEEPYVKRGCHQEKYIDYPEHTVEEGHVFVLGDHRDNSQDSRYFGDVDARCILGRVYLRIYPFADFGGIDY